MIPSTGPRAYLIFTGTGPILILSTYQPAVGERRVGVDALDLVAVRIDRVDPALVAEVLEEGERAAADAGGVVGGPDKGDGPGCQKIIECRHGVRSLRR